MGSSFFNFKIELLCVYESLELSSLNRYFSNCVPGDLPEVQNHGKMLHTKSFPSLHPSPSHITVQDSTLSFWKIIQKSNMLKNIA